MNSFDILATVDAIALICELIVYIVCILFELICEYIKKIHVYYDKMMDTCNSYMNRMFMEWMMYVAYKWSCVRGFFTEMVTRVVSTPMPMYVYKVLSYDSFGVVDYTDDYCKGLRIKNASTDDTYAENNRTEYRVTWNRTKKYRLISTTNSPMYPQHEMFVGTGMLSSRPKIICAVLKDDDGECNVTERVCKYAGPKHDFFGQQKCKMRWMFEDYILDESTVLLVLLSSGSHTTYGFDDVITN
jgi:hypothetical protein